MINHQAMRARVLGHLRTIQAILLLVARVLRIIINSQGFVALAIMFNHSQERCATYSTYHLLAFVEHQY